MCPEDLPYDTGAKCISCTSPSFFNIEKKNCDICTDGKIYNKFLHKCQECPTVAPIEKDGKCVACPEDTYYDTSAELCIKCPEDNTYDAEEKKCVPKLQNVSSPSEPICMNGKEYNNSTKKC